MTREDIIRMAREAGYEADMFGHGVWDLAEFNRFAALVEKHLLATDIHSCHANCQRFACVQTRNAVAAEREACCQIVWGLCGSDNVAQRTVEAIRARGNR